MHVTEATLDEILDRLPEKPSRSRLESYADFIKELRRRKRTYREIAQILGEKCQLPVSKSTVHRFLQKRSRRRKPLQSLVVTPNKTSSTEINVPVLVEGVSTETTYEVRRRTEELKQRSIPSETCAKEFSYDRDEPLHIIPNVDRNQSSDG
jgi:predicted CopG family antitoxin